MVGDRGSKAGNTPVYFWLRLLPWLPETQTRLLISSHSGKSEPAKIWILYRHSLVIKIMDFRAGDT